MSVYSDENCVQFVTALRSLLVKREYIDAVKDELLGVDTIDVLPTFIRLCIRARLG